MRINNNLMAMNTHRQLGMGSTNAARSMEKLSSGLRINRAGDDAAGLAISEKMRAQIRGLNQASSNAQDGISLIQTAEGALGETQAILQRMRELAVQSGSDTLADEDRNEIQNEIGQLTSEINRIGNTTEFNTKKLLNGDFERTEAVTANIVGTSAGSNITLSNTPTSGSALGSVLGGAVEIHSGKGASVSGAVSIDDVTLGGGSIVIGAGNNELTLTVNGTQKTLTLTAATYDGTAGKQTANLLTDINTQLDAQFGAGVATATMDATTNKLVITSDSLGTTTSVAIDGGNAATTLFGANWATTDTTETAGQAANNSISITVDGTTQTVSLTTGTYANTALLAAQLNTDIDTAFGSDVADVADNGGAIEITSNSSGSSSSVTGISGAGASVMGIDNAAYTSGLDRTDQVNMTIDGEAVSVTLTAGAYDSNVLAATLQSQINTATSTAADVTVDYTNGQFTITSGTEGSGGSVSVTDNAFAQTTGLSTSGGATATAGADAQNASLQFQIGGNAGQSMSVVMGDMRADALDISATADNTTKTLTDSNGDNVTVYYKTGADKTITNGTNNTGVEYALDVTSADKASAAVLALDEAIASVSSERSSLGSYQNRLEHTIKNLDTSSENLVAAESRIRDVDMAKEMMNFTKNNILQQAAQAMLAQANQAPQGVLQLLR